MLSINLAAMTHKMDSQNTPFAIRLIDNPVVANAKLKQTRQFTGQRFRLDRVKVFRKPTHLLQYLTRNRFIKIVEVLHGARKERDFVHLPFQTAAAGYLSRRDALTFKVRILKLLPQSRLDLGPESQANIRVNQ